MKVWNSEYALTQGLWAVDGEPTSASRLFWERCRDWKSELDITMTIDEALERGERQWNDGDPGFTLAAEVKRLRKVVADQAIVIGTLKDDGLRLRNELARENGEEEEDEIERLRAEVRRLEDEVLEHKDAAGHLRAALVGRGIELDIMRAENAKLRDA